eukprot:3076727-Pyramimonas_sp.AAC.1
MTRQSGLECGFSSRASQTVLGRDTCMRALGACRLNACVAPRREATEADAGLKANDILMCILVGSEGALSNKSDSFFQKRHPALSPRRLGDVPVRGLPCLPGEATSKRERSQCSGFAATFSVTVRPSFFLTHQTGKKSLRASPAYR